jgi:outer membrane protein assembly factor BamB
MRTNSTLTAYDARTGSQLWQVNDYFTSGTIAASRGVLYFKDFPHVIALNAATGAELWRADIGAGGKGAPALANGRAYVTESADSHDSELTVLNATTGAVVWSVPSVASAEGPSVANGVVYASNLSGKWDAYDARNGSLLWSVTIGGGCGGACTNAVPAVSNGVLYITGADGTLRAYSLP